MIPDFKRYIRNWPGNQRSDLAHLQAQRRLFPVLIEELAAPFFLDGITKVAAVDAGGLGLGGGLAYRLNAGLVLIRKAGRIDWAVESASCIDYTGTEKTLEITRDALCETDRVLVVDDWSDSGGQLRTAITLVEQLGAACLHITSRHGCGKTLR